MAKEPAKRGYSAFMNSDHRDPLHDSRNAMTEWEYNLRPRRERHWLMWVGLSALLMLGLYCGAEWLLAQRAVRPDGVKSAAPPMPQGPSPGSDRAAPSPPASLAGRSSSAPTALEVSKCTSAAGKIAYSDGPCPAGSIATAVRVDRNQNLADGMSVEAREASNRNSAALAVQAQSHDHQVASNASGAHAECRALDAHVKWLDTVARQPQGAAMQDWLREQRQQTRDRRFRLGCR